jgi:integrase/recombinase XerD
MKLKNVRKSVSKTIEGCYSEYLNYCISIGQRNKAIESKKRFYRYEIDKIVTFSDNISTLTKKIIETHIVLIII